MPQPQAVTNTDQEAGTTAHGGQATLVERELSTAERRRQTRVPFQIQVSYPRRNAFFFEYTRNISHGGMFIATTTPFDIGTRFTFALSIPGENEPVKLEGEVRWRVTPEDMQGLKDPVEDLEPGMGIAFLFTDEKKRDAIQDRVQAMIEEAFGENIAHQLINGK